MYRDAPTPGRYPDILDNNPYEVTAEPPLVHYRPSR